jgi:hypothetical protein
MGKIDWLLFGIIALGLGAGLILGLAFAGGF